MEPACCGALITEKERNVIGVSLQGTGRHDQLSFAEKSNLRRREMKNKFALRNRETVGVDRKIRIRKLSTERL